jgi:hypothetical protein
MLVNARWFGHMTTRWIICRVDAISFGACRPLVTVVRVLKGPRPARVGFLHRRFVVLEPPTRG